MTPNDECGKGGFAPIHMLPPLTFDMALDPNVKYGKADTPVNILPPIEFDLTDPTFRPALQIVLHPRPGVTPLQLSLDLFRLYSALNELELSLGGAGLSLEEPSSAAPPSNGEVKVTFKLTAQEGAVDRVNRLVRAVNKENLAAELRERSLDRCEARFGREA